MEIPLYADTVVIGGGTSGAVVAGLLAERSEQSVLVLEAGPDFGAVDSGRWPADLRDASSLGVSCDGGFNSESTYPDRVVPFERARVIGGCSSHNGCAAIWGSRLDYDGWAALGLPGWGADDLLPFFHEANRRMRVMTYRPEQVTPFQEACLGAAVAAGVPITSNLNDLDEDEGMAPSPVNISDGIRWNTGFAWLDPVRGRPNLTVVGDAPVSRVILDGSLVVAVEVIGPDGPFRVECGRVVVSAGTYESPAVLLRSGIGDAAELSAAGVKQVLQLPGVGKNLHDHPCVAIDHAGTPELVARMEQFGAERWMPEEQTIAKLRSPLMSSGEPGFDLHFFPVGGPAPDGQGWRWLFPIACMTPKSRGAVRLRSADPLARPLIDHRYLQDEDGHDRAVLVAGVEWAREIIAKSPLRELIGPELSPGSDVKGVGPLGQWAEGTVAHYYHPVGTCAMGPASDPMAVTDARGKVHGVDNLFVADCSIAPVVPRANTNIPAVVIGERIAGWLLEA